MTHMKKRLPILALVLVAVACHERKEVVRDTIPYVKQMAEDSTGTFSLVKAYRNAGTRGSIAVIGEPEACLQLAEQFLTVDDVDNIDGKPRSDRLPDFAGETFDILMDLYNAPYQRMAAASPDSLREVTVRNAVMAVDTVSYSYALDPSSRLPKMRAKVFVLASSLLAGYGQFDVDTLFKMAGREALVVTPVEAMLSAADRAGCKRVAVWAPAEACAVYQETASLLYPDMTVTVIPAAGNAPLRQAFREMLRSFRNQRPSGVLDAVLLDSFEANPDELVAEQEHIHRQITEEDMAFDRIMAPVFRFIEPRKSLTEACYRLLREQNLFTHDIAYPAARYYQTEENREGEFVLVQVSSDYLSSQKSPSSPLSYVPDEY